MTAEDGIMARGKGWQGMTVQLASQLEVVAQ